MSSVAIAYEEIHPVDALRDLVSSLTPRLSSDEIDRRRSEMLSLLDDAFSHSDRCANCGASLIAARQLLEGEKPLPHKRLSRREGEVMSMILCGKRLKEIAATLDISVKTVTTHRSRLLRKLGIEDNLGLYRYAVRNHLIEI
ncbi:MAG TPA: helix-turn-helix transcriptional regulator [Thermoanaerobaculia bacterium]|nr:helix-turn-helix transcriptional regulator [Thermoanaerobaculia bacterium]